MRNKTYLLFFLLNLLSFSAFAIKNENNVLVWFHKYNMIKCDKFISNHVNLSNKPNWHIDVERPATSIGKGYSAVTLITTFGYKDDTVKADYSFIETPDHCFLTERHITTFNGSCSKNIDGDYWFVYNKMPEMDYTEYRNKGDVSMLAKEVNVGNFKLCIKKIRVMSEKKHT